MRKADAVKPSKHLAVEYGSSLPAIPTEIKLRPRNA